MKHLLKFSGAKSIQYHMLNEESRKYFQRAFMISGTALSTATYASSAYGANDLQQARQCLQIDDIDRLIEHLKVVNASVIARCFPVQIPGDLSLTWTPTIESNSTHGAFLTEAPIDIYNSGKAPRMDTMFAFNSREYILFRPNLTEVKEPLLGADLSDAMLPFNTFNKSNHPKVSFRPFSMKMMASDHISGLFFHLFCW